VETLHHAEEVQFRGQVNSDGQPSEYSQILIGKLRIKKKYCINQRTRVCRAMDFCETLFPMGLSRAK
jgi:hypothetical protein